MGQEPSAKADITFGEPRIDSPGTFRRDETVGSAQVVDVTCIPSPTQFVGEGASLSERVRARAG
jgi:hypothetical protein